MNTSSSNHSGNDVHPGISDRLHDAGERVGELKDRAVRGLGKRVDMLGARMHEHPMIAIAGGLAIGYLLARIIHRG